VVFSEQVEGLVVKAADLIFNHQAHGRLMVLLMPLPKMTVGRAS
jgi:hypothetical protein